MNLKKITTLAMGGILLAKVPISFAQPTAQELNREFCEQLQNYVMNGHQTSQRQDQLHQLSEAATRIQDPTVGEWVRELSNLHSGVVSSPQPPATTLPSASSGAYGSPPRQSQRDRSIEIRRSFAILPPLAGTPEVVRSCFSEIPDPQFPVVPTCGKRLRGSEIRSVCFQKPEILSQILKISMLGDAVSFWSSYHKQALHLVQQIATKSCGPTVISMRLLDLGLPGPPSAKRAQDGLTNVDDLEREIRGSGPDLLTTEKFKFKIASKNQLYLENTTGEFDSFKKDDQPTLSKVSFIDFLERRLRIYGPVITSITDPKLGGHWIIVDEVSKTDGSVRIRDPYHGRMIDIPIDAFIKRFIAKGVDEGMTETMLWAWKEPRNESR